MPKVLENSNARTGVPWAFCWLKYLGNIPSLAPASMIVPVIIIHTFKVPLIANKAPIVIMMAPELPIRICAASAKGEVDCCNSANEIVDIKPNMATIYTITAVRVPNIEALGIVFLGSIVSSDGNVADSTPIKANMINKHNPATI